MPATRALLILAVAAAVSLVAGFGLSSASDPQTDVQVAQTDWVDRPSDVGDLVDDSTAVVKATVTSIDAGPDLVDPVDGNDPEQTLPTQRISFETNDILDGHAPETFKLFKTGSDDLTMSNDPEYAAGESYVLFIRPRQGEPGTYLPVAPDGRLLLDSSNQAVPVIEGPVPNQLDGLTPDQIDQEVSH